MSETEADLVLESKEVQEEGPHHKAMPKWCKKYCLNARGRIDIGDAHYTGVVEIAGGCVDAILDSGAARSMIDEDTANLIGLKFTHATAERNFGKF